MSGGGIVLAVDHQRDFADATRRSINRHGLESVVRVCHSPLTQVTIDQTTWHWYDVATFNDVRDIDLLIVDGPTQHGVDRDTVRYPALPLLGSRLASGAIILVDDADRVHERRIVERWTSEFPVRVLSRMPTEKGTVVLKYEG